MTRAFTWTGATVILFACGWLGITGCMAGPLGPDTSMPGHRAITQSTKAALQGDGRAAAKALQALPRSHFAGADIAYRRCMLRRFGAGSVPPTQLESGDLFVSGILHSYQTYWWHALMSPPERDGQGVRLRQDLSRLLGESTTIEAWDALEERLATELLQRGYYSQLGVTPPLRELMIWRKHQSSLHQVELPEGSHPVRLEVLSDFVVSGWNAYARCGRGSNAGWATRDRLYAVGPVFASGMNNDVFRASLLGHETQHFVDLTRFPNLMSWELEYRAKLTELWMSGESRAWLLDKFHRYQGDDRQIPHLFANKQVMRSLHAYLLAHGATSRDDLLDVNPETLRSAAREVLLQGSRERESIAGMTASKPPD